MKKQKNILEQNRGLLLQISLIIVLIIMLEVFNIETKDFEDTKNNFVEINLEIDTLSISRRYTIKPKPGNQNAIITEAAKFKGGKKALNQYLQENLKYPQEAKKKNIQGRVYVKFKISEYGKVKNIKVIRRINPIIDNEAKKLIKEMPDWIPAKANNQQVESEKILPIIFINPKNY